MDRRAQYALVLLFAGCSCEGGTEDLSDAGMMMISRDAEVEELAPPKLAVFCSQDVAQCNAADPILVECSLMELGTRGPGEPACEHVVEIRNVQRDERRADELEVTDLSITVVHGESDAIVDGPNAGFTMHELDGSPLDVSESDPLIVPIPTGANEGKARFKIRFSGTAPGFFRGSLTNRDTGLKITSNDPDKILRSYGLYGIGSTPNITVQPRLIAFEPVTPNMMQTRQLTIGSTGERDLQISSIRFENDTTGAELTYATQQGNPPFILPPNQNAVVTVNYRPTTAEADVDELLIASNDPDDSLIRVPIGVPPRLRVDPTDTLNFPNPSVQGVHLSNIGAADLIIERLEILGTSAADFSLLDCEPPCELNLVLCPPVQSCMMPNIRINVEYRNNDLSTIDLAELHIHSNDPADPEHVVVLRASDMPCVANASFQVVTPPPYLVGAAIMLDASSSGPNVVNYQWSFLFTPAATPMFSSQGTVTTSFVPIEVGVYVVGLEVLTDCGGQSGTASESITVQ